MTTGVVCTVYVDGVRAADGSAGDDLSNPIVLDDLAVTWGRSDTMSQPDPDTCTFEVMDATGGTAFGDVYRTGRRVDVVATGETYPDPTEPTFLNPGFETATVTWATSSATATRSTTRVRTGTHSLAVKPSTAAGGSVLLAPGPFSAPGEDPDAWDAIPTTSIGQSWSSAVSVLAPAGATVTVRPVRFSGPYATAGTVLPGVRTVVGTGAWETVTYEATTQVDGTWIGVQLDVFPTGRAWDEMPPTLTWDGLDPTLQWDELGTVYVDDVTILAPGSGTGRGVLVFSGRITDLSAAWDDVVGGPLIRVTAAGFTADLQNRTIASEPWTVESVDERAHRILELSGLPIGIDIADTLDVILLSYRDVDAQGATGLLTEIATSVDGVLWPAVHQSVGAYLVLEDPSQRASLLRLVDVAGPPVVVLRTNLAENPRAATIATGNGRLGWVARWFGSAPGAGTVVAVTGAADGPVGVTSYARKTWTVIPPNGQAGDVGFQHSASYGTGTATTGRPVTAGTTYTFSSYLRSSRASAASALWAVRATWKNAAGVVVGVGIAGPTVALPAGVWTRLTLTATAPAGAAFVELLTTNGANMTGITVGDTLDGTALLMEVAAAVGTYFDGSTTDTSTIDHAWTGAANASTSTASTIQTHTIVIVPKDPDAGFDLSACQILRDPVTWLQSVADLVTRVAVGWLVQGVDDDGLPTTTDATVQVVDDGLETLYGTRRVQVSTQLQDEADAGDVASRILARTSAADWRADGLTLDDDEIPAGPEGVSLLLDLLDGTSRIGAPVVLGELPTWTPSGATAGVYLEGGTYRFVAGRWVLDLLVSSASGLGQSAAWDELDPAWSWDQWDPSVTWNDLRGVAAP